MLPRRGAVYMVDFEPARPSEANKIRPAIVVTANIANTNGTSVVVIPITSKVQRVYPFQLLLPTKDSNLEFESKAQTELIRSVSKTRLQKHLGALPDEIMEELDSRIKLHLGLT